MQAAGEQEKEGQAPRSWLEGLPMSGLGHRKGAAARTPSVGQSGTRGKTIACSSITVCGDGAGKE